MSKKPVLILMIVSFFWGHLAFAGLIINEIMYDLEGTDTGREWIEIYNNGSTPIDLSNYKLFEANTNHGLVLAQGVATMAAQDYIIISSDPTKFKIDWPNFVGTIFDSSFSLSNDGESLAIKDESLNIVNQNDYNSSLGGTGDGKSLQLINSSWVAALPTPGTTNETIPVSAPVPSGTNDPSSQSNSGVTGGSGEDIYLKSSGKEQKIKTQIFAKTPAFVGVPIEFGAKTTGYFGETLFSGKYFWNFGDGDFKEMRINEVEKFSHTYFYPGEYSVSLEYYLNYYSENPEAVDKVIVKAIAPDILISDVGDEKDFFVELTNSTNYDADISKWILTSERINFVLPKNTILGTKKKMIISPKITNFSLEDKNTLKLMTPQREVIYDFAVFSAPAISIKTAVQPKASASQNSPTVNRQEELPKEELEETPTENLATSPILSGIPDENNLRSFLPFFAFFIFLSVASGLVYFVRQNKRAYVTGDDFEILDE